MTEHGFCCPFNNTFHIFTSTPMNEIIYGHFCVLKTIYMVMNLLKEPKKAQLINNLLYCCLLHCPQTIAAIWFNKIYKTKQLTAKYFSIKINGNNRQSRNTRIAPTRYRINQEIKFLYCKKQKLNEPLYKIHLECAKYVLECYVAVYTNNY
jgi:hypothetical protein